MLWAIERAAATTAPVPPTSPGVWIPGWEMLTALFTGALALFTLALVIIAMTQLPPAIKAAESSAKSAAAQTKLLTLESEPLLVIEQGLGLNFGDVDYWYALDAEGSDPNDGVFLTGYDKTGAVQPHLSEEIKTVYIGGRSPAYPWTAVAITNAGRSPAIQASIAVDLAGPARKVSDKWVTVPLSHDEIYAPLIPAGKSYIIGVISKVFIPIYIGATSATHFPHSGEPTEITARTGSWILVSSPIWD